MLFFLNYNSISTIFFNFYICAYRDSKERNRVRDTNDREGTYSLTDKIVYYSIVASCPKGDQNYNY